MFTRILTKTIMQIIPKQYLFIFSPLVKNVCVLILNYSSFPRKVKNTASKAYVSPYFPPLAPIDG
jgi:hypothetical protein